MTTWGTQSTLWCRCGEYCKIFFKTLANGWFAITFRSLNLRSSLVTAQYQFSSPADGRILVLVRSQPGFSVGLSLADPVSEMRVDTQGVWVGEDSSSFSHGALVLCSVGAVSVTRIFVAPWCHLGTS